ncbi:hypothetical protein SLA2020_326890 [Shorea laevis]
MEVPSCMVTRECGKHHFIHAHPLHAEQVEGNLHCDGCSQMISGPAYGCEKCNFHLHKSCLELPFEIRDPQHPMHPLFLRIQSYYSQKCLKCGNRCTGCTYHCGRCTVSIHPKCPSLSVEGEDRSSRLQHFIHSHPLHVEQVKGNLRCDGCAQMISGPAYGCEECNFHLHKSCSKSPFEIRDPWHPIHPLFLRIQSYSSQQCLNCGHTCTGCTYHCGRCTVSIHLKCASLTMEEEERSSGLQHFLHAHPLHAAQVEGNRCCDGCSQMISGPAYGCEKCNFHLHKSCSKLPFEIRDPRHPMHPLFLRIQSYFSQQCLNCGDTCIGCTYHCGRCTVSIHLKCASLTIEEEDMSSRLQHFIHSHPLHAEQVEGNLCCDGCSQMISGSAYSCEKCNFHLHKSCLKLPFEIRDPWHPMHPLFLRIQSYYSQQCLKCGDTCTGCTYHCGRCTVSIHLKCASLIMEGEEIEVQRIDTEDWKEGVIEGSDKEYGIEVQRSDTEDWEEGVTEGSKKEYEQMSYSEEEKIDAENNGSDAKEPDIAQLAETIRSLQDEAETLRKKIETLQAIKERLLNTAHQQS